MRIGSSRPQMQKGRRLPAFFGIAGETG